MNSKCLTSTAPPCPSNAENSSTSVASMTEVTVAKDGSTIVIEATEVIEETEAVSEAVAEAEEIAKAAIEAIAKAVSEAIATVASEREEKTPASSEETLITDGTVPIQRIYLYETRRATRSVYNIIN